MISEFICSEFTTFWNKYKNIENFYILAIFGKTVLATLFNTVPSGGQKIVFLQIILVNQVSKHLSFHLRPLVLS